MATHSSVLAWRIPGMGEPGGLLSLGSHRVGHDWSDLAAAAAVFSCSVVSDSLRPRGLCPLDSRFWGLFRGPSGSGEGNGNPLQYSCLESPLDGGVGGLQSIGSQKSRTRLSDFTFTFRFYALEKEMETHSSVLAWRIPGTEEPGGLPSMGSHSVVHDWSDLAAAAAGSEMLYF